MSDEAIGDLLSHGQELPEFGVAVGDREAVRVDSLQRPDGFDRRRWGRHGCGDEGGD